MEEEMNMSATETTATPSNDEMLAYLKKNYEHVEVFKNGVIHAYDGSYGSTGNYQGNEIYYNTNSYDTPTDVVFSYAGQGGSKYRMNNGVATGNTAEYRNMMMSDNPPNMCVAFSTNYSDSPKNVNNNLTNKTMSVLNYAGVETGNYSFIGNSASGMVALQRASTFMENNEDLKDKVSILINDGWGWGYDGSDRNPLDYVGNIEYLKDNDIPIVYVGPNEEYVDMNNNQVRSSVIKSKQFVEHLTEAGYNVYFVETDDTTHADVIKDSFSNDMPGYLAGRTPTLSGASGGGGGGFFKRRPTNYQTKKYNPETKEYYEANLSDAVVGNNSSGSSNTSEIKLVNLNEITGYEKQVIEVKSFSSLTGGKYDFLKDLDTFTLVSGTLKTSNMTLASNSLYVSIVMGNLKNKIKSSGFLNRSVHTYPSNSGGVMSYISGYITKYYDMMGDFMTKLNEEIEAVLSVSQAYIDMDNYEKEKAEELSDGDSDGTDSALSGFPKPDRLKPDFVFGPKDFRKIGNPIKSFFDDHSLLDKDPFSSGFIGGTAKDYNKYIKESYYDGAVVAPTCNGRLQTFTTHDGYVVTTDSSKGKVYVEYKDSDGNTKNVEWFVKDDYNTAKDPYHTGGTALSYDKNGNLILSVTAGNHINSYDMKEAIESVENGKQPTIIAQSNNTFMLSETTDPNKVLNNRDAVSSIGNGSGDTLLAIQYHNPDANKNSIYYGPAGSEMVVVGLNENNQWEEIKRYTIDGNELTKIQGVCQDGNDCWFTSSSQDGTSALYYATLNDETNTVEVHGSIPVPKGAEGISIDGGKLFVAHEGRKNPNGSVTGENGYGSVLDANGVKEDILVREGQQGGN